MKYSRRRSRRLRNPNEKEPASQPFFGKSNDTSVQAKEESPFFQAKLTVGKPGDKYEKEADAVADAVVNQSQRAGGIQKKENEAIQKSDLATPLEEEKLSTAEQKLERDKEIQEKPDLQAMDKEEEEPMQMQAEEEEEMAQMQAEEEEEPMQMQAEEEEEMAQMQAEEEEEPMQMQAEEEEEMAQMQAEEEEEPMQMQAEEEEEMAQMQAEEEEEPMQMQAEEEEEMAQMQAEEEEEPMQMQAEEEEEMAVQAKRDRPAGRQHATAQVSKKIKETKGRGKPIPEKARAEMEQAFGVDFSGVSIHTGQDAVQMNKALRAQAFASGKDVFFNTGKFNPENSAGKHLLAHELAHVVQQNNMPPKASAATPVHRSSDEAVDWYKPWIRVATYKPGDSIGYSNIDLGSLKEYSTGWKRNAVSTGLLSALGGVATAVGAKKLGLSQLLSLLAGGASAYARGHEGYHVKERIRGTIINLHNWYGRYKYNLFTNELLAVDFQGIGPDQTSLIVPWFFEEAIMDADNNLVYVHTNEMNFPGVDVGNHFTLPEKSIGTI